MDEPSPNPAPRPVIRRRRRRWVFPALAVLLGLTVGCAGLEVFLWALGYELDFGRRRAQVVRRSPDPEIGYELIPGAEGIAWLTQVKINSKGRRDPEPAATPGARRVALLGDSVTFGVLVPQDEIFSAELRRRLGETYAVENHAITGYGLKENLGVLAARVGPTRPDVVVMAYCLNDIGVADEHLPTRELADRLHRLMPFRWRGYHFAVHALEVVSCIQHFLRRNTASNFATDFAHRIAPLGEVEPELAFVMSAADTGHPVTQDWYTREARVGYLRWGLTRFRALADQHGFRPVVLLLPFFRSFDGVYPYQAAHRVVTLEARRAGVELLDPLPSLVTVGLNEFRVWDPDDIHPNPRGHAILAEVLEKWLTSRPE